MTHETRFLTSLQHAVDIEATIRNGALDVGIFAPEEMMSIADAEGVVEEIRAELNKLGKEV